MPSVKRVAIVYGVGACSSAGFARAVGSGGGFGGGRRGPLRRSGMGEHIVMIYGREAR
jgi:hypothetical protein